MQKGNSKEISEEDMHRVLEMMEDVWKKLFLKIEKFL